jgi:hypothetical protein
VYIVYASRKKNKPIYIGCSGKMQKNWEIKHHNDGLYGRICQGKQFDTSRKKSWPMKMRDQNIDELQIHWYVTFDEKITDIPA